MLSLSVECIGKALQLKVHSALRRFASGLVRDQHAVQAALTLQMSSLYVSAAHDTEELLPERSEFGDFRRRTVDLGKVSLRRGRLPQHEPGYMLRRGVLPRGGHSSPRHLSAVPIMLTKAVPYAAELAAIALLAQLSP